MIIKRQKNEKKTNAIFKFSNLARECWKRDAELKVKSRFFLKMLSTELLGTLYFQILVFQASLCCY